MRRDFLSLRCGHDAGNTCRQKQEEELLQTDCIIFWWDHEMKPVNLEGSASPLWRLLLLTFGFQLKPGLTLKVDLLHDVLGLDALLLVVDEDLSFLVLRPAVFVHPHLHLRVCSRKQLHTSDLHLRWINQLWWIGSYPAGLPASQPVTGGRWSGRWCPPHGRWLQRRRKTLRDRCPSGQSRCCFLQTILTLANGVLKASDAVDELPVLLQTRLNSQKKRSEKPCFFSWSSPIKTNQCSSLLLPKPQRLTFYLISESVKVYPKALEVAGLQQVPQVEDLSDGALLLLRHCSQGNGPFPPQPWPQVNPKMISLIRTASPHREMTQTADVL